jgi:hypothetical protein
MSAPQVATKTMRTKFMYIQSYVYQFIFDECCKVHLRFRLETLRTKNFVHTSESRRALSQHSTSGYRQKVHSSQHVMRSLGDERKISDNETSGADDFRLFCLNRPLRWGGRCFTADRGWGLHQTSPSHCQSRCQP